ncbi:hypothetical protein [Mycobacterium sp.]
MHAAIDWYGEVFWFSAVSVVSALTRRKFRWYRSSYSSSSQFALARS